jgi:flagellar biogenesis protein FliO
VVATTSAENISPSASNHTNVGAIVGGVVGGVALLALIAFGIWFVRFQKHKEARSVEKAPVMKAISQGQYKMSTNQ